MYHRVRKKMFHYFSAIILLSFPLCLSKSIDTTTVIAKTDDEYIENNIIDFDEEYTLKFNKKYGTVPWHANDFDKNSFKYTIVKDINKNIDKDNKKVEVTTENDRVDMYLNEESTTQELRVIPLELISTTEDPLISLIESTTEPDLTVIPLSTTEKIPKITVEQTVTLPTTENSDIELKFTTEKEKSVNTVEQINVLSTAKPERIENRRDISTNEQSSTLNSTKLNDDNSTKLNITTKNSNTQKPVSIDVIKLTDYNLTSFDVATVHNNTNIPILLGTDSENTTNISELDNSTSDNGTKVDTSENSRSVEFETDSDSKEEDVPIFTELDTESQEDIPEDYYDTKDVVPTPAPKTDAISVLFGLAGSVVESVAERVVPKSIFDLFKRMQKQNEALEAERLRSREENGGLGQFGRGILKTISTGLSKPLTQLMESKANGSLDTDRGFVAGVTASVNSGLIAGVTSVANVANSVVDAFKDKVQAIYPGTVWCGDGRSAQARSGDLGLFFFTDTCCRQHDACKLYIRAGESKYGLTNTGLFTRSHCSCDTKFRDCLRRTNSLVSGQIGLTYFNVLGPQCFRRAHPIVKCLKKTRITGQKCEEYELDYTKPKMWQWFDNETF